MIISASRRTDIPSYYSEWFFNRIKEQYVLVRNPMNVHQISKISLSPNVVDGIVFWTKNPKPMIERLHLLDSYYYYFQFTVNSYGTDIEPNIPSKNDFILPVFKDLSSIIGANRVIWRYDPIIITDKYTVDYHIKYFKKLAEQFSNYTKKCVISFVDLYRNAKNNMRDLKFDPIADYQIYELANAFKDISRNTGIKIESCSEEINLLEYGIEHGHCIDCELFEEIIGVKLSLDKDKNQRKECGCASSIDIGSYNTCRNACKYCYANYNSKIVEKNSSNHNPLSPLLFGEIGIEDKITERKVESCKQCQITLFDNLV